MILPPRIAEVLPDCKALLLANSDLTTALGGSGRVYVSEGDELTIAFPATDANGFASRVVLMDVLNGVGSAPENLAKVRDYPFKVRVDVIPVQSENYNAKLVMEYIHGLIYQTLHGQKLALNLATPIYPVKRTTAPSPMFSTQQGWKYMSASYLTILKPKS